MATACRLAPLACLAALLIAPGTGWCADSAANAMLLGAAYKQSDLRPLGPGLTTLQFVPGRGLVRSAPGVGPAAVSRPAPPEAVDGRVTPYARFSEGSDGAGRDDEFFEFGVVKPIRLSTKTRVLSALNVTDGRRYGGRERWFLFAAVSGEALGYSFLRGNDFNAGAGGWTLEKGGFVGQAQAGVGWRKSRYQATLSYFRTEIRVKLHDVDDVEEDRVGFTWTRFSSDPSLSAGRAFPEKTGPAPPD